LPIADFLNRVKFQLAIGILQLAISCASDPFFCTSKSAMAIEFLDLFRGDKRFAQRCY
jgi:hypothetical protein